VEMYRRAADRNSEVAFSSAMSFPDKSVTLNQKALLV